MTEPNRFLQAIQGAGQAPPEEGNRFLKAIEQAEPQDITIPIPDENPFAKALEFASERDGSEPVEDITAPRSLTDTPEFDERQLSEYDAALERIQELVARGFHEGASGFYAIAKGLSQWTKRLSELGEQAGAHGNVFSVMSLLDRGAEHLSEKFGGTKEGALDLMTRQFDRLQHGHKMLAEEQGPAPQNTVENIITAVGALPQEAANFTAAYTTGGIMGVGAMRAAQAQGEGRDPTQGFVRGAVEGGFARFLEWLVPAVPKNFRTQAEQAAQPKVESRLNLELDAPQREPSFLNPAERAYVGAVREFYALEKAAKQVGDRELRNTVRTSVGNAGNAQHFLEFGGFHPVTKQTTGNKALFPIWKQIPRDEELAFKEYLVAKRAAELESRGIGSGQPMEQAQKIVVEGDANPLWRKVADELYAYQDDVLRYARDSGMLGEAQYNAIKAENQFYVPYQRAGFEEGTTASIGRGQPSQPIKKIEGSQRAVIDPLKSIVRNTVRILNEADKNRLGQQLVRHVDDPRAAKLIKRSGPVKEEAVTAADDPLASIGSVGTQEITEAELKSVGAPSNFQKFRVYEDGRPTEYLIDPDIANAIGTYNLKTSSDFVDNIVMDALSVPAQVLRSGTVETPRFFLITNPVRDALTLNFQSQTGAKPGLSLFDGLFSYLKRDEVYKLWVRSGGANSTLVSMDKPQFRSMFREMISDKNASAWREIGDLMLTPLRAMQEVSQAMEAGTRLGEFKQGLRNVARTGQTEGRFGQNILPTGDILRPGQVRRGMEQATPQQLGELAVATRDVTTDFAIKGRAQVAQAVRKLWAFSNANLQGLDRFIRIHKENPGKAMAMGTMYLTIPSLILHHTQMQDETYREAYRRLPNWRKMFFWNMDPRLLGREVNDPASMRLLPIPIPFEWGLVYKTIPEQVLSSFSLDDPGVMGRLADTVWNQSQPFLESTIGEKGPVEGGLRPNLPTAIQPIMDVKYNRRSFFDIPIHTPSDLQLPSTMRFGENTARSAVVLSEWMKGFYSPKEIEVLLQGYGGSLARSGLKAADELVTDKPFGDVPQFGAFADQPGMDFMFGGLAPRTVEEGQSQVVSDFWDRFNSTAKAVRGYRELLEQGQAKKAQQFFRENEADIKQGWIISGQTGRGGYAKEIMALNKRKRTIIRQKGIPRNEKERIVKQINRMVDLLASRALNVPPLQAR